MSEGTLYRISREQAAPAITAFVLWVFREAKRRGIRKLYFLARDGYALLRIAESLPAEARMGIDCSYLYCSRMALRTPSYHLIGEEAYDLLFTGGYHVTLDSLFERADISGGERRAIEREAGVEGEDAGRPLNVAEIEACREKLLASPLFRRNVMERSQAAYDQAAAYFRQEGLFDQDIIGIVDSGWSGSMQRSLRQLMEAAGFGGRIVGFYFGMYAEPKEARDGEYLAFYFSRTNGIWNKTLFSNNLFECMLSAPHGMTIGYEEQDGTYGPVLAELPSEEMLACIAEQIRGLLHGAQDYLADERPGKQRAGIRRLRSLMSRPGEEEARAYGAFLFCDDVTEKDYYGLASEQAVPLLKEHTLLRRARRSLTGRTPPGGRRLFWIYGDLAFVKCAALREWYRLNFILWDLLRYALKK